MAINIEKGRELLLQNMAVRQIAEIASHDGSGSVSDCLFNKLLDTGASKGYLYAFMHTPSLPREVYSQLSDLAKRDIATNCVLEPLLGMRSASEIVANALTKHVYRSAEDENIFFQQLCASITGDTAFYTQLHTRFREEGWIDVVDYLMVSNSQSLDFLVREAQGGGALRGEYCREHYSELGERPGNTFPPYQTSFFSDGIRYYLTEERSLINIIDDLVYRETFIVHKIDDHNAENIIKWCSNPHNYFLRINQGTPKGELNGTIWLEVKGSTVFYVDEIAFQDNTERLLTPFRQDLLGGAHTFALQHECASVVFDEDQYIAKREQERARRQSR